MNEDKIDFSDMNEGEMIKDLFCSGPIEAPAPLPVVGRHLLPQEKELLWQFSYLRYLNDLLDTVSTYGWWDDVIAGGVKHWSFDCNSRGRIALDKIGQFFPFDDQQKVIFAYCYLSAEPTGAEIDPEDFSKDLNLFFDESDWKGLVAGGVLEEIKTDRRCIYYIPERVMDAVAMVDMIFGIGVLHREGPKDSAHQTALFLDIIQGRKKNDGNPFSGRSV